MFDFLLVAAVTVIAAALLLTLGFSFFSGRFFKHLFFNALLGIAALFAIRLTSRFTGVDIAVNWWTVSSSAFFGIPAVCGNLLLILLFSM